MPASAPSSTFAYRLKALQLCVRGLAGNEAAERFFQLAPLSRPLEDETRPISRNIWVTALPLFQDLCGLAGFAELHRYIVHPKNLAFWSPLLRNADDPGAVYSHLADSSSEPEQLSEWREEERGPELRRLSTPLPETDPNLRDLMTRALCAELEAVPLLFGRPRAKVGPAHYEDGRLFLSASFLPPPRVFGPAGVSAAALGGLGAAGAALVSSAPALQAGWVSLAGAGVASAIAWALGREAAHRSAATFQKTRILALEREARVRREQTSESSASRQESVIAGEYRIGEQLGVGGASAVWEAHRLSDGQAVALKLLRTAIASDSRASDRLQREAEALGLTWHPHVVKVHDHGLLPSGLGYLVMERLRGETLSARVRRLHALPLEEVLRFGIQAADALFAVHQAGIVHRDIKPANLFVHRELGGEILKLFDFGVAHVNWAETRLTRDGGAIGTPGYAAPEQEDGEPSHPTADLFSLGVSLLELLTGDPPSSSGSARRLRTSRPPAGIVPGPRSVAEPREVLADLHQLLDEMTALDPEKRPPDAREVATRLRALLVRLDAEPRHPGLVAAGPSSRSDDTVPGGPAPQADEPPSSERPRTGSDRP